MISVLEFSGAHAITTADGDKLFHAIQAALKSDGSVDLDFSGVRVFASPFFNASIGRMLKDHPLAELMKLIHPVNLSQVGEAVLALVIQNSEQYYRNPDAKKALDSLLEGDTTDVGEDDPGHRS